MPTQRKKVTSKKRHPRTLSLLISLLALCFLVQSFFLSEDTASPSTYPHYKELLKTPLNEVVETLSSSEQNDPVFLSLMNAEDTYPEVKILIAHHDLYPSILLELAASRPETLDFVINYPNYIASAFSTPISIQSDYSPGSIPLFIQWDKRWGYEAYGDEYIASSACGPTALSMVAVGLTGNTELHPKAVADFSKSAGYFHSGIGTSWSLMTEGASKLGLTSRELPLDANVITKTLEKEMPIILSMRPGHFTQTGHFIVLTGISADGRIIVNDPGSIQNSEITWDLEVLMNETKNLWAFSAA